MPNVYIKTFGCQMNVYDSENILKLLASLDYKPTSDPREADIILINTCSVREKSEHKFYSLLGRVKKYRKPGKVLIGACGCVAQQEGKKLLEKAPYVDIILGTGAIHCLPELIDNAHKTGKVQIDTHFYDKFVSFSDYHSPSYSKMKAFVTIMKGCDNFCSFCIVPYVRGREKSRPSKDIITEVRNLVDQGVKEVTLLGQNVNSYSLHCSGEMSFPELLREINRIEGLSRIRFVTSHPKDLSDQLITCFGELEKLCPHIHLPLQSGSTRILKMMNRGYTRDDYLAIINQLRTVRPDIGITTDLIVGFPGETESDFQATLDIITKIGYDEFYSFKYSDRPKTQASRADNNIPEKEKARRLHLVQELQKPITFEKNNQLMGKALEVLVEGPSKNNSQNLTGRSGSNKVVNFEGCSRLTGKLVQVEIIAVHPHSLFGRIL